MREAARKAHLPLCVRALLVLAPLTCESPKELPVETERSPIRPEKLGTVSHAHTLPQSPPCINGAGTLRLHGVNRRHVQAPRTLLRLCTIRVPVHLNAVA